MKFLKNYIRVLILITTYIFSSPTLANPVACFNTSMGDFCMELFEKQAPKTVANFLQYIENESYLNSIFHRSIPGFVMQTGGIKIISNEQGSQVSTIETLNPIENEFGISNTRGTVAMAKLSGNPDSATSQWFINLSNNSDSLNKQNGGFTVFGQIINNGMQVIEAVSNLPVDNLSKVHSFMTSAPTIDYNGQSLLVQNLVLTNSITVRDTNSSAIYSNDQLMLTVDIGNSIFFEVTLNLIKTEPDFVFVLDPLSIKHLQTIPNNNVAIFSALTGRLKIPSVLINDSTIIHNIAMSLTDETNFQFTLMGYDTD